MNVGEKRRSQLGSCDYQFADEEEISLRLSSVGDYRGRESFSDSLAFILAVMTCNIGLMG